MRRPGADLAGDRGGRVSLRRASTPRAARRPRRRLRRGRRAGRGRVGARRGTDRRRARSTPRSAASARRCATPPASPPTRCTAPLPRPPRPASRLPSPRESAGPGGDERRRRQRHRGAAGARARRRGGRRDAEALGRPPDRRRAQLLLAGGGGLGPRSRPLAGPSASDPRPRAALPGRGRRPLRRRLRGRADPQPLRALQRRGADRGDGRPRRPGSGRAAWSPATTRASSTTATGRCWPPPPTRPRTRATCSAPCRRALLDRLRFPLAELRKPEVREIAARHGLAVARRPESQDLCFLAGQGKRAFLRRHGGLEDRDGELIDTAAAAPLPATAATITSRSASGAGSASPPPSRSTCSRPTPRPTRSRWGPRDELRTQRVAVRDVTLHRPGGRVDRVRLRYRSRPVACASPAADPGRHERLELEPGASRSAAAAPGQLAALMCGETIVGHGTIATG